MELHELLREELDRAIGHGPAPVPVEHRIEAGRRVLRRRRLAAGIAALAATTVVGAGGWAISPGGPTGEGTGPVAVEPTRSSSAEAGPGWEDDVPVRYLAGKLEIRPGVRVHERVESPLEPGPHEFSVALDLTFEGQRMWVLLEGTPDSYGYFSTVPSDDWRGFDDWLAAQVAVNGGHGWPRTLRLTDDGRVVAVEGAEVVQRTDDPQLGGTFAPPGTPTGAAVVTVDGEAGSYFVVWRVVRGQLDVITTPPADVVGATFEELLSYARSQYASGKGLR